MNRDTVVIIEEDPRFKAILRACLRGMRVEGVLLVDLDTMCAPGDLAGLSEALRFAAQDQAVVLYSKNDAIRNVAADSRFQELAKRTRFVSQVRAQTGPAGLAPILEAVRLLVEEKNRAETTL